MQLVAMPITVMKLDKPGDTVWQTQDGLFDEAVDMARSVFGSLPTAKAIEPMFIAVWPHMIAFAPCDWADEEGKLAHLSAVKFILTEEGPGKAKADRYAMISEVWIGTSAGDDDPLDKIPPSKRNDRQEALFILVVERNQPKVKAVSIAIERDWTTGARSLGAEMHELGGETLEGRMTTLLGDR